jgi:hypothetical protein
MGKALPVLIFVAAFLVALGVLLFPHPGQKNLALVVYPVVLAVGGVLILRAGRANAGLAAGIALLLLGMVDLLSLVPINGKAGLDLTFFNNTFGPAFITASGLAIPAVVLGLWWQDIDPMWLRIAGAVAVGGGVILILLTPVSVLGQFYPQNMGQLLPAAILALASAAPGVSMLMESSPGPAAPTSSHAAGSAPTSPKRR